MSQRAHAVTGAYQTTRRPRLLWASAFCLLDTSSGAALSVRQMLLQLQSRGYEIKIIGATVFDSDAGLTRVRPYWPEFQVHRHGLVQFSDDGLVHDLLVTPSIDRHELMARDESTFMHYYIQQLEQFKPDLVWLFGGLTLEWLIAHEARYRGIPVAFYLVNQHYSGERWCRDVDAIITDSQTTSDWYLKTQGYRCHPVGKFIDSAFCLAKQHLRKHVLFVNPSFSKGACIVAQVALWLERRRPDIVFEIVESRGDWHEVVRDVTSREGETRDQLQNVMLTLNSLDMASVYSRARVVFHPSLWWESGARVLAEAMLNGIPAIISDRGGQQEMIQDGGIVIAMPDPCYQPPHRSLLTMEGVAALGRLIERMFDDEVFYDQWVKKATLVGQNNHDIDVSTDKLLAVFQPLVDRYAGEGDFAAS